MTTQGEYGRDIGAVIEQAGTVKEGASAVHHMSEVAAVRFGRINRLCGELSEALGVAATYLNDELRPKQAESRQQVDGLDTAFRQAFWDLQGRNAFLDAARTGIHNLTDIAERQGQFAGRISDSVSELATMVSGLRAALDVGRIHMQQFEDDSADLAEGASMIAADLGWYKGGTGG